MQVVPEQKDALEGWQRLVTEIYPIEGLIVDNSKRENTQSSWSLHLLRSASKMKQQRLKKLKEAGLLKGQWLPRRSRLPLKLDRGHFCLPHHYFFLLNPFLRRGSPLTTGCIQR
jgi:hypothetical protein